MLNRSKKRPRDPNQLAYQVMLESTGQAPKFEPPTEPAKNPAAVSLGRLGGLKGGKARAAKLDPRNLSGWDSVRYSLRLARFAELVCLSLAAFFSAYGTLFAAGRFIRSLLR